MITEIVASTIQTRHVAGLGNQVSKLPRVAMLEFCFSSFTISAKERFRHCFYQQLCSFIWPQECLVGDVAAVTSLRNVLWNGSALSASWMRSSVGNDALSKKLL